MKKTDKRVEFYAFRRDDLCAPPKLKAWAHAENFPRGKAFIFFLPHLRQTPFTFHFSTSPVYPMSPSVALSTILHREMVTKA